MCECMSVHRSTVRCASVDKYTREHVSLCVYMVESVCKSVCLQVCVCGCECSIVCVCVCKCDCMSQSNELDCSGLVRHGLAKTPFRFLIR